MKSKQILLSFAIFGFGVACAHAAMDDSSVFGEQDPAKTFHKSSLIREKIESQKLDIQDLRQQVSNLKSEIHPDELRDQAKDIRMLQQDLGAIKNDFYDKTMQNVNLALQSANRATTLVSMFAITFTVISFFLGFFGFKEINSIHMVRAAAEKILKLTSHISLGYAYARAFLYKNALNEFVEVIKIDPNNTVAHTELGFYYGVVNPSDFQKSKFHSNRAVELDPNNFTGYLNLGVSMAALGEDKAQVLRAYLKGEELAKNQMADDITIGKFILFAGDCYKDIGEKVKAKTKYDEARPFFDRQKINTVKEISAMATNWLTQLDAHYAIVTH